MIPLRLEAVFSYWAKTCVLHLWTPRFLAVPLLLYLQCFLWTLKPLKTLFFCFESKSGTTRSKGKNEEKRRVESTDLLVRLVTPLT